MTTEFKADPASGNYTARVHKHMLAFVPVPKSRAWDVWITKEVGTSDPTRANSVVLQSGIANNDADGSVLRMKLRHFFNDREKK